MSKYRADLHMHSVASDGVKTAAELIEIARAKNLTHLAITDHDTMEGSLEAATLLPAGDPMQLIIGVEMTMERHGCHLLAYGRGANPKIADKMAALRTARIQRAIEILDKLEADGMPLDRTKVLAKPSGYVGLPTIAKAMMDAGYIRQEQEAYRAYIGHGCKYYVSPERMKLLEAIPFLRSCGFVPVLAHPMEMKLEWNERMALIRAAKEVGLMGIEVWHPSNRHHYTQLKHYADDLDLLTTSGSDFHRPNDWEHSEMGSMLTQWITIDPDMERLLQTIKEI